MQTSDLDYELPLDRIAQHPTVERDGARLLVVDRATGELQHLQFRDLPQLLRADDLLVRNVSRVLPARLIGKRSTGGHVEILITELRTNDLAWALVQPLRRLHEGEVVQLESGLPVTLRKSADCPPGTVAIEADGLADHVANHGAMPLPPYIRREASVTDRERYQTVYATSTGSAAAPTAGLHFTNDTFSRLAAVGVRFADVVLHVGLGTFLPVRTDTLEDHLMHEERFEVPQATALHIEGVRRQEGGRVLAVGTTTVRCLESAARSGELIAGTGRTDLFIRPGFEFRVVDGLLTNFHQPRSTLLALVAAFAGLELMKHAYRTAVAEGYRFLSYGDTMFIR